MNSVHRRLNPSVRGELLVELFPSYVASGQRNLALTLSPEADEILAPLCCLCPLEGRLPMGSLILLWTRILANAGIILRLPEASDAAVGFGSYCGCQRPALGRLSPTAKLAALSSASSR